MARVSLRGTANQIRHWCFVTITSPPAWHRLIQANIILVFGIAMLLLFTSPPYTGWTVFEACMMGFAMANAISGWMHMRQAFLFQMMNQAYQQLNEAFNRVLDVKAREDEEQINGGPLAPS